MNFRLVPKSVTLNDLERCNGVILRCFSEFGYLPGALRKSSRSLSHLLMSSCNSRRGKWTENQLNLLKWRRYTIRSPFHEWWRATAANSWEFDRWFIVWLMVVDVSVRQAGWSHRHHEYSWCLWLIIDTDVRTTEVTWCVSVQDFVRQNSKFTLRNRQPVAFDKCK